jgi:hypothetical protein
MARPVGTFLFRKEEYRKRKARLDFFGTEVTGVAFVRIAEEIMPVCSSSTVPCSEHGRASHVRTK